MEADSGAQTRLCGPKCVGGISQRTRRMSLYHVMRETGCGGSALKGHFEIFMVLSQKKDVCDDVILEIERSKLTIVSCFGRKKRHKATSRSSVSMHLLLKQHFSAMWDSSESIVATVLDFSSGRLRVTDGSVSPKNGAACTNVAVLQLARSSMSQWICIYSSSF